MGLLVTSLVLMLSVLQFVDCSALMWRTTSLNDSKILPFCQGESYGGAAGNSSKQASFTFDQLWDLQNLFLKSFMSPSNAIEAKSINSKLLAPNVLGRVDITRTFAGQELNTEYLFGLFANLASNNGSMSLLGYPLSYEIVHFAASQNIVSASTIIQFNFAALGLTLPVMIDTWNMWNPACEVMQYDATFRWFDYLVDTLMQTVAEKLSLVTQDAVTTFLTKGLANSICQTHETYCKGNNKQYDNEMSCFNSLTTGMRFGKAYELGRNTLLCRMVHQNMVPLRPEVHCPHIGPSGGGMCVDDQDYAGKVMEKYFVNAPFIPFGYGGG